MNTDSHYRKEIINKLLRNKKNNASKSLKSDKSINIKNSKSMIPMHISLKTPLLNLTNECSQYEYNIKTTVNTNLDEISQTASRICICIYRIIHCRNQQNVKMPFLEYLLYKYPESKKKNLILWFFLL